MHLLENANSVSLAGSKTKDLYVFGSTVWSSAIAAVAAMVPRSTLFLWKASDMVLTLPNVFRTCLYLAITSSGPLTEYEKNTLRNVDSEMVSQHQIVDLKGSHLWILYVHVFSFSE